MRAFSDFRLVACALLLAATSCKKEAAEVCAEELPKLEQQIAAAVIALTPWTEARDRGRRPASLPPGGDMALADRLSWQRWADGLLSRAQAYTDAAREHPGLRDARDDLSRLASQVVVFHGYAGRGDSLKMTETLEKIQALSRKVADRVCR